MATVAYVCTAWMESSSKHGNILLVKLHVTLFASGKWRHIVMFTIVSICIRRWMDCLLRIANLSFRDSFFGMWHRKSHKVSIFVNLCPLQENTNRKPHPFYRMVPLSMTSTDPWPEFQGYDIFRHWISQKRHATGSYYRTSIRSHMRSNEWRYFQWPWRRSRYFWSRLSQ